MLYKNISTKILFSIVIPIFLTSCATINGLMANNEESSSEIKEISLNKRLQISIPIPENSKYVTDKTIIFGEGSRFTGVLYLIHETSADEVVEFYVRSRKEYASSDANYIESLIDSLQFIKTYYQDKEDEQS